MFQQVASVLAPHMSAVATAHRESYLVMTLEEKARKWIGILGAALNWTVRRFGRPTNRFDRTKTFAFALAHKYTENTLPNIRATDEDDREIWTRDPARLRGRDAVLYATLDKALRAYCGPNPGDDDFDDEMCYCPRPPLRVELIKIRDFKSPRGGEAPEFWVGEIWDGQWTGRRRPAFVNRNEFAARLKRAEPTRTSLYTGNEGMESGYIYTSAVIMLGESCIGDY